MPAQDFLVRPTPSAQTTEPQGLGAAPPAPSPRPSPSPSPISPAERDYLLTQGRKILGAGGSEQDFVNFVQTHRGMPLGARVGAVTGSMTETGGNPSGDPEHNFVSGMSLNAVQGITFGFGDEAIGGILGILTGAGAAESIEAYRSSLEEWNSKNRKKAFVAEMAGGFATGAGAARLAGAGAKALGTGGRLAVAAGEGAISGGFYSAGNTEGGWSDRTAAALFGGAVGGVLGPAAVGAMRLGGGVVKPATRALIQDFGTLRRGIERLPGVRGPKDHASNFLLDVFESEGLSIDQLRKDAAALANAGISPTLADLGGPSTLEVLSRTLSTRSPVKQKLAEAIFSRQAEQGDRLTGGLYRRIMRSTNFGLRNAYDAVDDLKISRATTAAPLYEEAFQGAVPTTPRMQEILSNPKFRAAWDKGRELAQLDELAGTGHGLEIPDLPIAGDAGGIREMLLAGGVAPDALQSAMAQVPPELLGAEFPSVLPIRGLDYAKRGIDNIINGLLKKEGIEAGELRALTALKQELVELTAEADPTGAYGRALTAWGDPSEAIDAVELGRSFLKKEPPIVQRELAAILERNPGHADFYRLGAAQALYEAAGEVRKETADLAGQLFGGSVHGAQTKAAQRIRALFPDAPDVAEDFLRQVTAETRISQTAINTPTRGRLTRGLQESVEGAEGPLVHARMTGKLAILGAMQQGLARVERGFQNEVSDELAQLFTYGMDSPLELKIVLDGLEHAETQRLFRRKFGREMESGFVTSLGLMSGKVFGAAGS